MAEKQIGTAELRRLCTNKKGADSRAAEERGAWGEAFKAAQEKNNLDPIAFGWFYRLWSMQDSARASRILRNLMQYCDQMQVGGQTDLEDVDTGEAEADPDDDLHSESAEPAHRTADGRIDEFRTALKDADSASAVSKGLERFIGDHPHLRKQAEKAAQARVLELDAEFGDGAPEAQPGYANRQNAIRAGRRVGKIENPVVYEEGGRWFYREPAAGDAAPSEGAALH